MMKAISLYQPWATLVAIGEKKIETRSWRTDYRGPLAIHASKNDRYCNPKSKDYLCDREPFYSALQHGFRYFGTNILLLGGIVATCNLDTVIKIPHFPTRYMSSWIFYCIDAYPQDCVPQKEGETVIPIPPDEPELSFGDYTPGRYAWVLDNVKVLDQPISAKGKLGLWNCEGVK